MNANLARKIFRAATFTGLGGVVALFICGSALGGSRVLSSLYYAFVTLVVIGVIGVLAPRWTQFTNSVTGATFPLAEMVRGEHWSCHRIAKFPGETSPVTAFRKSDRVATRRAREAVARNDVGNRFGIDDCLPGHRATETMPQDACRFFYDCRGCGALLKPKAGDCCVFCSYGDVKCPPLQATGGACCP